MGILIAFSGSRRTRAGAHRRSAPRPTPSSTSPKLTRVARTRRKRWKFRSSYSAEARRDVIAAPDQTQCTLRWILQVGLCSAVYSARDARETL